MRGHGHVIPNADGTKARCGGPVLCTACALELNSTTQGDYSPLAPSPAQSAKRNSRHILRLARLAFPAIRVGHTTLVLSHSDSYVIIPRRAALPFRVHEGQRLGDAFFSRIELRLRAWRYFGKRRILELTLAYDASEDVCVVLDGSVRMAPVTVHVLDALADALLLHGNPQATPPRGVLRR